MNRAFIIKLIADEVEQLAKLPTNSVVAETPLLGEGRVLRSHDLVVLMLAIEDRLDEEGRVLEWPVQLHRTLATVGSLADFLEKQL